MAKLSDINILSIGNSITQAGAVYAGEGKLWLVMFPNQQGYISTYPPTDEVSFVTEGGERRHAIEVLDMDSADWEAFLRQTDLLETEGLGQLADGTIAKVILRKTQRSVEQGVSWRVFKRDGYRCRYCANDDTPLTVDHLVLWEVGGPSIVANLVSACRKCNKTRGNKSYADWLVSPDYKRLSAKLDEATRKANLDLLPTLDAIPRMVHKPSR